MAKRHVLKSGLLKWAKVVSRTLGVNIVFSGHQPRTDGKTIYAFSLPDMIDKETERALIGAIDHECGHIDPEKGSMLNTSKFSKLDKKLRKEFGNLGPTTWNVLEDMRIETCLYNRFPGCHDYLEAVRSWLWKNADSHKDDRDKPMTNSARSALLALAYVRFPKLFREIILPRASTEILMLVRYWTHFVVRSCNADDVWETYDLTVELLRDLQQMSDGSGGGEGAIDSGLPGKEEGQSPQPGDQQGQPGQGQPQPGQGQPSEGGSGGDAAGDGGEQGKSDSSKGGHEGGMGSPETSDKDVDGPAQFDWNEVYESHPNFKDVNPESAAVSNAEIRGHLKDVSRRVIDDSNDVIHIPDFGAGAMGELGDDVSRDVRETAGYRIDDLAVRVERATETQELSQQVEEESANMFPVLKQRLRTLLLARRANRHRSECYDGEIDPGSLYALAIPNGPRNVFTQLTRGKTVATAGTLLIDGSSSMRGKKAQTVMRCARFFSGSLERCVVPTEVAVFQNSHRGSAVVDYKVVKGFDEKVTKARARFSPMASGGTPMAEAMVEAVRRLSTRREPRKLLFILTDGAPNGHTAAQNFMVRLAEAAHEMYGIETIGLGVDGASSVGRCFKDFVMLDKGSRQAVEKNFIDVLHNRVLRSQ